MAKKRGEKKKGENAFNDYSREYVKGITRCSARHKDSPKGILLPLCKAQPQPSICTHGVEPGRGRSMSHTPRLRTSRQELQTSPMETQAGTCSTAVPGEQSSVPRGTHSCIPSFHCPRKRARARTRIPANAASADGGSSTGGSPGFAILPGARRAAAPREQGTPQAQLSLCLPALQRGALPTLRKALQSYQTP